MNEFLKRHTGPAGRLPRQKISRLAFLLAGLLIAVSSASLLFVGYVASNASEKQSAANEQRLIQNALADRLRAIVSEQIRVTSSDKSVVRLVRNFSPDYLRRSFDKLWTDYSHSKVLLVSGTNDIIAESFEDYTHIVKRPLSETPDLQGIIQRVQTLYMQNRVRVPGGFGHRALQGLEPGDYAAMGVVQIDGKPALFGAMPILPDNYETTLPDGMPTVLLSANYIDDRLLGQLNAHLKFTSFRFVAGNALPENGPYYLLKDSSDAPFGAFRWERQTANTSIWPTIVPVVAILSVALAVLAFGIAWRIGQLTTSLQASEEQNLHLALHDALSGLANRLQFNRVLEAAVGSLSDKPVAVIHCDLDRFKEVNDTFGHAAGDEVIRTMALRLKETVGNDGLVCRVGGDEFMVIYRGPVARPLLRKLCDALLEAADAPVPLQGDQTARIGLSIGIAVGPKDGATAETLVSRADAALYHSKNEGRARFSFFSELPQDATEVPGGIHAEDGSPLGTGAAVSR